MAEPEQARIAEKSFIDRGKLRELSRVAEPGAAELDRILSAAMELKGICLEDAARLLAVRGEESVSKLLAAAGEVKRLIYGKRLVFFAPLYASNTCANNCLYCGFRRDNTALPRVRLSPEQVRRETELLLAMGHKRVLVIGGEDAACDADYYVEAMRAIYSAKRGKDSVRRVNMEVAPLEVEDFVRLREEKLGTYICFQETYDEELYASVHPSGPKRDFLRRLLVMDRAMRGGQGDVGIGALFGLGDWRFEVLGLLEHSRHLEESFGVGPHTVSVPRIERAEGAPLSENIPAPVPDESFRLLVAVIRLALPFTGIILSTRESAEMRNQLFRCGVSQISAGSRVNPGGYSEDEAGSGAPSTGSQFSLGDHRSLDEVISEVIGDGYVPSFCTGCYRRGRVGKDFMDLAKPGLIHEFCLPNGLFTFKEYLEDYASPETRAKGERLMPSLLEEIESESVREKARATLERIASGERDFYL